MSTADKILIDNIKNVLSKPNLVEDIDDRFYYKDGKKAKVCKSFFINNSYNIAEEFPCTTISKLEFKNIVALTLWIWQKKSNNINDLDVYMYGAESDKNGIVKDSFGSVLRPEERIDDQELDVVDALLYRIKHNPNNCNLSVDMSTKPTAVVPSNVQRIDIDITNNQLNMAIYERSADVLNGSMNTVGMYAILMHMIANECGLKLGILQHIIGTGYIFDRHITIANDIIKQKGVRGPKLVIDPSVKSFYDYNINSFVLVDYKQNAKKYYIDMPHKK